MLRLTQKIFSSGTTREPSNGAATKKGGGTPQTKISPPNFKATIGENIGSNFWPLLKEILPPPPQQRSNCGTT